MRLRRPWNWVFHEGRIIPALTQASSTLWSIPRNYEAILGTAHLARWSLVARTEKCDGSCRYRSSCRPTPTLPFETLFWTMMLEFFHAGPKRCQCLYSPLYVIFRGPDTSRRSCLNILCCRSLPLRDDPTFCLCSGSDGTCLRMIINWFRWLTELLVVLLLVTG